MRAFAPAAMLLALAGCVDTASVRPICRNVDGVRDGRFVTFWHDTGSGCMTLARDGRYAVRWTLPAGGNLVAGMGWASGTVSRVIAYRARSFEPGSNGYLGLYGWSVDPLVEYYVVDSWGAFTPPGAGAVELGTVESDGGTYRVYRTQRIRQPSIAGTATFHQYWSVRTQRRPLDTDNAITFANHVAGWRRAGLLLGTLRYQVLATEGFGSTGSSDVAVREARPGAPLAP